MERTSKPRDAAQDAPKSDPAEIERALRLILQPGQVTELRALDAVTAADRRPHTFSGYFDDRNDVWKEPIDRNVFGLLDQFGDAELASMIAPRALIVEYARGLDITSPRGDLKTPKLESVQAEFQRIDKLTKPGFQPKQLVSGTGGAPMLKVAEFVAKVAPYPTTVNVMKALETADEPLTLAVRLVKAIRPLTEVCWASPPKVQPPAPPTAAVIVTIW